MSSKKKTAASTLQKEDRTNYNDVRSSPLKEHEIEGLTAYLKFLLERQPGESFSITKENFGDIKLLQWRALLERPPLSSAPIDSDDFRQSTAGRIPRNVIHVLAAIADVKFEDALRMSLHDLVLRAKRTTEEAAPNGGDGKAKAGRKVSEEELEVRNLVLERWKDFQLKYKEHNYSKASYENFAEWATNEYDNMPTNEPAELEKMIKAHRKWLRENPGTNAIQSDS